MCSWPCLEQLVPSLSAVVPSPPSWPSQSWREREKVSIGIDRFRPKELKCDVKWRPQMYCSLYTVYVYTCSPRDSVDAHISESSTLYLSNAVDENGRDPWDGVGTEWRQTSILEWNMELWDSTPCRYKAKCCIQTCIFLGVGTDGIHGRGTLALHSGWQRERQSIGREGERWGKEM